MFKKTGRVLGVGVRLAGQNFARSRTLRALSGAVRTTARSFAHTLHALWLEVTGTIFLTLAAFGGVALVREYVAGRTTASRLAIGLCFTLAFAWFGLTSFLRVRRKSQRP